MDKHFYTFIIEKIKEQENMEQNQGIPLRIPAPFVIEEINKINEEKEKSDRGVIVIEM